MTQKVIFIVLMYKCKTIENACMGFGASVIITVNSVSSNNIALEYLKIKVRENNLRNLGGEF